MKQPVGILVIMGYFLVAASTVLPALGSVPRLPLLQVSIVFANLVLMLFVAGGLFRMQGWSRWASIAMLAITLVRISIQLIQRERSRQHDRSDTRIVPRLGNSLLDDTIRQIGIPPSFAQAL